VLDDKSIAIVHVMITTKAQKKRLLGKINNWENPSLTRSGYAIEVESST